MSKRIALLAVVAVALLVSASAFGAETPSFPTTESFLASLQASGIDAAPATPADVSKVRNEPEPIFMALPSCSTGCCDYSCQHCTATTVKLCAFNHCTGKSGCEACHSGTTCSF
jgi:hypothetical protein